MIDTDEVPLLLKLAGEKECEYQAAEGRDLYCLAPSANDETARWVVNGRSAAPTSKPICGACSLPDTGYLCSNFSHAEVLGFPRTQDSGIERQLIGGMCQAGRSEINSEPGQCRPSGSRMLGAAHRPLVGSSCGRQRSISHLYRSSAAIR